MTDREAYARMLTVSDCERCSNTARLSIFDTHGATRREYAIDCPCCDMTTGNYSSLENAATVWEFAHDSLDGGNIDGNTLEPDDPAKEAA